MHTLYGQHFIKYVKDDLSLLWSTKENEIFAVICQLKQLKRRPEKKNSGSNGIWTHDLCDSGANALPLGYEATGSWSIASSIYTR